MEFHFGKRSAHVCTEQIVGRLRQYIREIPEDKMLTVDEFAERVAICLLNELREFDGAFDAQLVIVAAMGMLHACMQTIACESNQELPKPQPITKEMVN